MKVLIACEESQEVCKAFRSKGHEAFSCDLQPCSGGHPEWHIRGDVLALLNGNCLFFTQDGFSHGVNGKWDMIIAHPPCTYLSNAGTRQFSLKCNDAEKVLKRWEFRANAAVFFMYFVLADCDKIVIENPVGFMNSAYRKPDQIIHPYFFADSVDDSENFQLKRTCLWLKGVQPLIRKSILPHPEPSYITETSGKKRYWCEGIKGSHGGREGRAKLRSKTFPCIARAMAEQWG